MANNPKKVKGPTEVALSAIQEALEIGDTSNADHHSDSMRSDSMRNDSMRNDTSAPISPPVYGEASLRDETSATERPIDPIDGSRPTRRAANDDRKNIGQILQAIQKGRPARSAFTLAVLFTAVWVVGALLLTISFLPSLQAAMGKGAGGTLVLAGLLALFVGP